MNTTIDLISTERDLLNQYTESFNQKQDDVLQKYDTVVARLDDSIRSENDETAALAQLQMQLDTLSLTSTLDKFRGIQSDLTSKFDMYTAIVQENNKLASTIFDNLKGTKELVTEILGVVSEIDTNIGRINMTIDTYSTATTTTSDVVGEEAV